MSPEARSPGASHHQLSQKIGFIGAGNMARAILTGIVNARLVDRPQTIVSDVSPEQLEKIEQIAQPRIARDNAAVVEFADVIILAVKPFQVADVCASIRQGVKPSKLFISICAGIKSSFIEEALGGGTRVVRAMPNTPALIGCGATALASGSNVTEEDLGIALRIFNSVGKAVILSEDKLDLVTGLTGSGPAYVFQFIEALINAGARLGLDAATSETLVRQMVYGAARMAMESETPLPDLRQSVTTKGGTTEAGLRVLAEGEFDDLLLRCVSRATDRSRELSSAS